MSSIEIWALIFSILILIKLFFVITKPESWMKFTKSLIEERSLTYFLYVILAIILGYTIFTTMPLVNVVSVMFFTSLLIGITWLSYPQPLLKLRNEIMKNKNEILNKNWLIILFWAVLALFVIYQVLF